MSTPSRAIPLPARAPALPARTALRAAALIALPPLLAACGDDAITPPGFEPLDPIGDTPLPTLTDVDFEALGPHRIAFWRESMTGVPGLYLADGVSRTVSGHLGGSVMADPRVSPDGSRVAAGVLSDLETFYDVNVVRLDGGGRVRLAALGGNAEGPAAWSPDGSEVLFATSTANPTEIRVRAHPADGSGPGRIALTLPEFSALPPVVALSTRGDFAVVPLDRVILAAAGSEPETVYRPDEAQRSVDVLDVDWSPSGDALAVIEAQRSGAGYYGEIRIRRIEAGVVSEPLARLSMSSPYGSFAPHKRNISICWSRDGSTLFFTGSRGGGEAIHHVYAVPAAGGEPRQVTTAPGFADVRVSCL